MYARLSRRDFIKLTGSAVASIAAADALGLDILNLKADKMQNPQSYYALFGVDESIIQAILSEALSAGGDYADLFFQDRLTNSLGLEDNIINAASARLDRGVGIRVIKGDQTGYSYTEDITPAAMKDAARVAASIAGQSAAVKPVELKYRTCCNYYKTVSPMADVNAKKKIALMQELNSQAFSLDSRIKKCRVRCADETSRILIADSTGLVTCDYQPMALMSLFCLAQQGTRREEGWDSVSRRSGSEFLDMPEVKSLAKKAVHNTIKLFDAASIKGGEMPVVLASGDRNGVLLHEAMGHGMEADFNRKSTSIFADKLHKPVAEKFVTILDDATCPNQRGSINIDDEGTPGERTILVRDGVLESYMHDHISAKHYSLASTGSGRRESFRFSPLPRMRNTYMLPGPHSPGEIVKSVKHGLFVDRVGNGQVAIGAGDFSFYVISGRLIENGELTRIVKDVNIIGNGPVALADICMVGNDFKMEPGGGTCGKDGQAVPVSFGMPTVKISKLTVGAA